MRTTIFLKVNDQLESFVADTLTKLKFIKSTQKVEWMKQHSNLFLKVSCLGHPLPEEKSEEWFDEVVGYFAQLPLALFPFYCPPWALSPKNLRKDDSRGHQGDAPAAGAGDRGEAGNRKPRVHHLGAGPGVPGTVHSLRLGERGGEDDSLADRSTNATAEDGKIEGVHAAAHERDGLAAELLPPPMQAHACALPLVYLRKYMKNRSKGEEKRRLHVESQTTIIESIRRVYTGLLRLIEVESIVNFQGCLRNAEGEQVFTGRVQDGQPLGKGYLWNTEKDNTLWKRIIFIFPLRSLQKGQIVLKTETKYMIV